MRFTLVLFFCITAFIGKSQSFYKTPSGNKYHLSTCRMVRNVSEEITVTEATKLGLQPCKICQPQNIYAADAPSPQQSPGTKYNSPVQRHDQSW